MADNTREIETLESTITNSETRSTVSIACGSSLIMLAMGVVFSLLDPSCEETDMREESALKIERHVNQAGSESDEVLSQNRSYVNNLTEQYNLPPNVIEALIVASSEVNPNISEAPESYRSLILLEPERVGVTGRYLQSDDTLCLTRAAELYSQIAEQERDIERAVARFFVGDKVDDIIKAEIKEWRFTSSMGAASARYYQSKRSKDAKTARMAKINWIDKLPHAWQRSAIYITLNRMKQ